MPHLSLLKLQLNLWTQVINKIISVEYKSIIDKLRHISLISLSKHIGICLFYASSGPISQVIKKLT